MNAALAEMMGEVANLVIRVTNETDKAVFFNISGHVNNFDISVGLTKENYSCKIYHDEFIKFRIEESTYTDETEEQKQDSYEYEFRAAKHKIRQVISTLKRILKGEYTKIVEVDPIKTLDYEEVMVLEGDVYRYVSVGAAGRNIFYDDEGNVYDRAFIEVVADG
jgi:hypothetical protein